VDATEVVQVYAKDPRGTSIYVRFWKRLVGYGRLFLSAGACGNLTLPISADDLAIYDDSMQLRVVPGMYLISAGGASNADLLTQNATVT
jgi:hypothetical protein